METPPSPFYEVPNYFFPVHFFSKKNRWFWRVFEGCCNVFECWLNPACKHRTHPSPTTQKQTTTAVLPTHFVSKVPLSHLKRNTWSSSLTIDWLFSLIPVSYTESIGCRSRGSRRTARPNWGWPRKSWGRTEVLSFFCATGLVAIHYFLFRAIPIRFAYFQLVYMIFAPGSLSFKRRMAVEF